MDSERPERSRDVARELVEDVQAMGRGQFAGWLVVLCLLGFVGSWFLSFMDRLPVARTIVADAREPILSTGDLVKGSIAAAFIVATLVALRCWPRRELPGPSAR